MLVLNIPIPPILHFSGMHSKPLVRILAAQYWHFFLRVEFCPHTQMFICSPIQKRFIYRLLTRHDFLPVWLVADK